MSYDIHTEFEKHRPMLEGMAYRMCGVLADAQDIVQETHLRWSAARHDALKNPRAWLVTTCSRLAMDLLKSARVRREQYVGTWLPEPFLEAKERSPEAQARIDDSVSMALMLALERLSPPERAAFLLHDVFGYEFGEIARIIDKSEAACRKLASRARMTVQQNRPRYAASPETHRQLLDAFLAAVNRGEPEPLKALLAESVAFYSDGGGKVKTSLEVLQGKDEVASFFLKIWRENVAAQGGVQTVPCWFNGQPGVLIYQHQQLRVALSLSLTESGISHVFALRNPDKLTAFERRAR